MDASAAGAAGPTEDPDPARMPVVGWREWVALPDLGIDAIKAKVDTGARTSALHAFDLVVESRTDGEWVSFQAHPIQRRDDIALEVTCPVLERREVRSSNGEIEERIVVSTSLVLGGVDHDIELTLTNRDEMGFRMLLGREALKGTYLVDPGSSYLQGLDRAARAARATTPRTTDDNGRP